MTRHLLIFSACFLLGAAVTAAIRTARHDAYAGHQGTHTVAPATAVDPHAGHATPTPAPDPHAGHRPPSPAAAAPAAAAPVNTVCALCGMPVDPKLETATYQGKVIGFGCRACPPRFAADPDRYGPAALKNQVVEE